MEAIERLKRYRSNLFKIRRLQYDMDQLYRSAAPSMNITSHYDANKGGYVPPAHSDAFKDLASIAVIKAKVVELYLDIDDIENALGLLEREQRLVLIMKYIDEYSISLITEALGYSSRQTTYSILKTAVKRFEELLPIV